MLPELRFPESLSPLINKSHSDSEDSSCEELDCQEDDDVAHLDFPFSFYVLFPRLKGAKKSPSREGRGIDPPERILEISFKLSFDFD